MVLIIPYLFVNAQTFHDKNTLRKINIILIFKKTYVIITAGITSYVKSVED